MVQFSSIQLLSHVRLFATPWTEARQASESIANSRSLLRLMSVESSCHLTISSSVVPFSSCLQPFPASGSFLMTQFFSSGGQNIGVSASASVLPMNIQDWFPLGWTGWISLQSKGLSRVFSNTTVQKHQFFGLIVQLSDLYMTTGKTIALTRQTFIGNVMFSVQKTKGMASSPITSWQIDGETLETVRDFIFLGSKITAAMKLKDACSSEECYDQPR